MTEERFKATKNIQDFDINQIKSEFTDLGFSERIWKFYFINALGLIGVKRMNNIPYATHPTRMAMNCQWLCPPEHAEDASICALMHDYLEETGGISKISVAKMRENIPNESIAIHAAVFLSEPMIDYLSLGPTSDLSKLKRVAYVLQAHDILDCHRYPALANASLADKLDNLHDLEYLTKKSDSELRKRKIAERLAFFSYTLAKIGPFAKGCITEILQEALAHKTSELSREDLVQEEIASLHSIENRAINLMRQMILDFHQTIDLARL
ncbi:MAG: hypothetical protein NT027_03120, partial [Proteobacteria bacterium]|nr:hypothetical protein [Pseudomonadota bacterium]